jgi:hypothetical protein
MTSKKENLTIGDLQEIELILLEAAAWGLRTEVEIAADKYIEEGQGIVDSYHFAYEDWVK